jgi:hypothetical protein
MLLATVSAPPMPDGLVQRLQATLAEESARRASAAETTAATAGRKAAGRKAARWNWRPRVPDFSAPLLVRSLAATGVLALIVAGGLVLANLGTPAPTRVSAPEAAPSSGPAAEPRPQTNAPIGVNSNELGTPGTLPVHYRYQGAAVTTNVVVSNLSYTKSDLAAGVRASISSPVTVPVSVPGKHSSPGSTSAHRAGISARQLAGCLAKVAAGHRILLAEVVRYLGLPATIVVLKPIGHIFNVIVVGAACSATETDALTRLSLPKS